MYGMNKLINWYKGYLPFQLYKWGKDSFKYDSEYDNKASPT
jgi:hypothetical protein